MQHTERNIGIEAAKAAVLAYNGIRREDASFQLCRPERDTRDTLYHIVFYACMLCYECYVDAETFEVRGSFSAPEGILTESVTDHASCACA